jgi:hypothetical protein
MAYIKISDIKVAGNEQSSGTKNVLTELQETESQQIIGGISYIDISSMCSQSSSPSIYDQPRYWW